jgi:DNA-binding beta-propeller fold protein YncE
MTTTNSGTALAGKLYFVSGTFSGAGAVKVIDADGSNEITLCDGKEVIEPDGIEVDLAGGKMYWTDMGLGGAADKSVAVNDGRIMRADLDGKNLETLVPTGMTTTPKQLALDVAGGKVYWSDRGDVGDKSVNPKIMRSNLDGSSLETIVSSDLMSPVGIALDTANGKVYFTDRYANDIKRANLDGGDVEVIVRNTEYPVDLALDFDNRVAYWTARQAGGLYSTGMDESETDGASLSPIITGLHAPIGVTLDRENGRLFYTDVITSSQSGGIWVADLAGSHAEQIATTSMPLGLYFVP